MRISKSRAGVLKAAVDGWVREEVISREEGERLLRSLEVAPFDWKRATKYSFWIAIICIVIAVGSVLADQALMAALERIFSAPALVKCLFFAAAAGVFYRLGFRRRKRHPQKVFSSEAILFLGVLLTAASIFFLGTAIDTGNGHFSILLLLAALVYAVLGVAAQSNLIWLFALVSIGGWFGAETGYMSGWGAYYFGMNYPLRFAVFGPALIAASFLLSRWNAAAPFERTSRAMGYFYLFMALWILSIFGNYGDMHSWHRAGQFELFHWSLLFGLAAGGAIFYGIRSDDAMSRGFGVVFLFINLYTRFFEHFWDHMHKAIFFFILGVSFWCIGTRAEKIWNLGRQAKSGQHASPGRDDTPP